MGRLVLITRIPFRDLAFRTIGARHGCIPNTVAALVIKPAAHDRDRRLYGSASGPGKARLTGFRRWHLLTG